MHRLMALTALFLAPAFASAGLVTQTSYFDWGFQQSYTFKGDMLMNTHELRFAFDSDAPAINNITLELFSGDFDLAMHLYNLSEQAFLNGPTPTTDGTSPYVPGSPNYLGRRLTGNDNSGIKNSGGYFDPRLKGNTTSRYFSLIITPSGTTDKMVREHDVTAMQNLLMAQQPNAAGLDFSFDLGLEIREAMDGGITFNNGIGGTNGIGGKSADGIMRSTQVPGFVADVPESSTYGLFALAIIGMLGVRKRFSV